MASPDSPLLTDTQMRVYRALASLPQPARWQAVADAAAVPAPAVLYALGKMRRHGYVDFCDGGRGKPRLWSATSAPPEETRDPDALTVRQHQVLATISRYWQEHGYGPSVRDLCGMLDIGSPNGVVCHLRSLQKKGLITWGEHAARSIRPNGPAAGMLSVSRTAEGIFVGGHGPLSPYQARDLAGKILLEASHLEEGPAR